MAPDEPTLTLKARYAFPVAGRPLADAFVTIGGERIVAVGQSRPDGPMRDLGDVAIVPGFVNAHAHLEFSLLDAPIGHQGIPLPDWIRQVVAYRRAAPDAGHSAVIQGLRQSLASGTTMLGEIATSDWRHAVRATEGAWPGVVMFRESIAPKPDRIPETLATAEKFLRADNAIECIRPALSPHAPYTVHPALLTGLVELARRFRVPLAMHLAESREELDLLESGSGRFRELLEAVNAWSPRASARYTRVMEYLEQLARAPRALVIHGNYLAADEIDFLAVRATTMSVVYCPRTHHFFGHEAYPLAEMLQRGVSLALGTDSRASNPDLDLLAEMRFMAEHHPLPLSRVLQLGTLDGARALGLDEQIGTLEPGKLADFAIVALAKTETMDPHELLFAPAARVVQTWLRGAPVPRAA